MRLLGHPVHAALVAFPIALLAVAPIWDLGARFHVLADGQVAGYFCLVAGLVGAGLAVVTGFADFLKIADAQSAAAKAALTHAGVALTAVSISGVAFALRGGRAAQPSTISLVLELVGALGLGATGWLGGHLVFHHRVGVDAPPPANRP